MIRRSISGVYTIGWYEDFVPWLQWKCWRATALRMYAAPKTFTLPLAAPPENATGIAVVIDHHTKLRTEIDAERGGGGSRFAWPPLLSGAEPFVPWLPTLCGDLEHYERARRKIDGTSFYQCPVYALTGDAVLRQLKDRVGSVSLQKTAGKPLEEIDKNTSEFSGMNVF